MTITPALADDTTKVAAGLGGANIDKTASTAILNVLNTGSEVWEWNPQSGFLSLRGR
jgi:hypothetical protein